VLDAEARLMLQRKCFPRLEECTLGAIRAALAERLRNGGTVLDAGCSSGTWILQSFKSRLRFLVGTDICQPVDLPNMPLVLADLSHAPFADAAFDLIVCYNVIEHLPQPERAFVQFARMLKVGGALVFKTPSLHAPLIVLSRFTPHVMHQRLKKSLAGAGEVDVFPTYYRCNTPEHLDQSLRAAGLRRELLLVVDQTYEYLAFSRLVYALGLLYSRMIQAGPLQSLGTGISGVYVKAAPGGAGSA